MFFVKQKTAYEMRISDWSSDVCSSDLLCIPLAHLEAGLRSNDRGMPEEINRIVTDRLADLLWTPSPDGDDNLIAEGVPPERIEFVGNIMIDAFGLQRPKIEALLMTTRFDVEPRHYGIVTLTRTSHVDERNRPTRTTDVYLGRPSCSEPWCPYIPISV